MLFFVLLRTDVLPVAPQLTAQQSQGAQSRSISPLFRSLGTEEEWEGRDCYFLWGPAI